MRREGENVREHTAGIVCLTGGRRGELARRLVAGDRCGARDVLRRWVDWFGADSVWVELHDNLVQGDRPRIRAQVSLARELGVGIVATGSTTRSAPSATAPPSTPATPGAGPTASSTCAAPTTRSSGSPNGLGSWPTASASPSAAPST